MTDTSTPVQTARDKAQDDVFHDLALTYTTADAPDDTDMVVIAAQGPSGGFAYIRTTPLIARDIAEELLIQANRVSDDDVDATDRLLVRAKGLMDGATTLAECAELTRQFGNYLQNLHDTGNELVGPVTDDCAFYTAPTTA